MSGRKEMDLKIEQWISEKLLNHGSEVKAWMTHLSKNKTPMTRRAYLGYMNQYIQYCNKHKLKLLEIKPMHIDQYIDELKQKGNGNEIINAKLSALISFYKFLQLNDLIIKNPCDKIEKLKIEDNHHIVSLTDKEINQIKNSIEKGNNRIRNQKFKSRDLAIIALGCSTGLRISEILNIDMEDINMENKTIEVIVKGDRRRTIYFGDNTKNLLQEWIDDREMILDGAEINALFINASNNRLGVNAVREMLKKETSGLDKHITPHKMRSTCAMNLYDKTGDIYLVAEQLGHKNIKNTMIYAEATEEKRRQAAEILD